MFSGEGKYERMNGGTQVEKIGKGQYHLKKKKDPGTVQELQVVQPSGHMGVCGGDEARDLKGQDQQRSLVLLVLCPVRQNFSSVNGTRIPWGSW